MYPIRSVHTPIHEHHFFYYPAPPASSVTLSVLFLDPYTPASPSAADQVARRSRRANDAVGANGQREGAEESSTKHPQSFGHTTSIKILLNSYEFLSQTLHGTAIYADQLGWCQGVNGAAYYGSPMECMGIQDRPCLEVGTFHRATASILQAQGSGEGKSLARQVSRKIKQATQLQRS